MQDIAIKSAKNGGPDTRDILTAMQASHLDATEGRIELAKKVEDTAAVLHKEVMDAARQRQIDIDNSAKIIREDLRNYRLQQSERCAEEHKKLFEQEISQYAVVRAARRASDPESVDYTKAGIFPELTFSYKLLKWFLAVLFVVALGWSVTFWADSCARQNYWGEQAPTLVSTPSPTESP